jgi:hypothetical protein
VPLETDLQADSAGDPPALPDAFATLRFVTALPVRLA